MSCRPDSEQLLQIDGTKAMIDSIDAIYMRTDFRNHPYEYGERIKHIKQQINIASQNNKVTANMYAQYAQALFYAGDVEVAVSSFEDLINNVPGNEEVSDHNRSFHEGRAIANLRLGELRNCIANHNSESCIFPIQGEGIHKDEHGSRMAIHSYSEILKKYPADLQSRWLLNLAYMTLGEYPEKVPSEWLIPSAHKSSIDDFPRFQNIAMELGLDINELAGGVVLDDFNNDNFLDIMVSSWGMRDQLRYFENDGKGSFIEKTETAGLIGLTGGLNLKQTDYNNDDLLDLYVMRGAWKPFRKWGILPNSLLKNNGDGTFSDVTIESGLYSQEPSQSCVWRDFNNDGWLDLFVGNETVDKNELHPCEFYLNDGQGKFINIASEIGLDIKSYIKGCTTGDFNNDGWPDLYISSIMDDNLLFINQKLDGNKVSFLETSKIAGVEEPSESFPCWVFDYNNDGREDLFVASFDQFAFKDQASEVAASYLGLPFKGDVPRLFENLGNGKFKNVTKEKGLAMPLHPMGCNFGDLNNDGYLDFYLGTGAPDFRATVPNRMFLSNDAKQFVDVTSAGRFGNIQKGHGIAFGDLDNDGDKDIYAVMGGSYTGDNFQNSLFENPGFENNWVIIKCVGVKSNKAAIGARVKLTVNSPTKGNWEIHRTVNSGASFGANSLQLEIGIGDATKIETIEINWPDKQNEYISYGSIPIKKKIVITEGQSSFDVISLIPQKFNLKQSDQIHKH